MQAFQQASRQEGRKIFGMMVVDEDGRLAGMLSMYDILLYLRPKHIQVWGVMDDIDIAGIVNAACEKARSIQVGDIMTPEVVTITPQTHILRILDIMIKKHIRKMIFSDIHRLFVRRPEEQDVGGVISLSDAARIRSGSCHACMSSRINMDTP